MKTTVLYPAQRSFVKICTQIMCGIFLIASPCRANLNFQKELFVESSEFSFVLKPSLLGGIGVFAAHDIPAGMPLFRTDHVSRIFKAKDLDPEFLKFCIHINDEECRGPERFDRLEIGWFINHSHTPNIAKFSPEDMKIKNRGCYALRDIKKDEEILIDYNCLNEPEHLKEDYYKPNE